MECQNCELKQRQFYCENCLKQQCVHLSVTLRGDIILSFFAAYSPYDYKPSMLPLTAMRT